MSALDEVVLHCQMAADGNNDLQWANEAAVELAALRRERDAAQKLVQEALDLNTCGGPVKFEMLYRQWTVRAAARLAKEGDG